MNNYIPVYQWLREGASISIGKVTLLSVTQEQSGQERVLIRLPPKGHLGTKRHTDSQWRVSTSGIGAHPPEISRPNLEPNRLDGRDDLY